MKMILAVIYCLILSAFAEDPFDRKKPQNPLTPVYGILTHDDLGIDAWLGGYNQWQCFPRKYVEPKYRVWRDSDPMGYSDVTVTLCDLEININYEGNVHSYGGRRAHPVSYCREFIKQWKNLTKAEPFVCLNGDKIGGSENKAGKQNISRDWIWEKFKTRRGCYAHFDGYCDVSYWMEQGYPNSRVKL